MVSAANKSIPADAERYRVEQEAEAMRNAEVLRADAARQATIAAAQAEAEKDRLTGEGERARRAALAEAAAIEGAKEGEAEQRRRSAIAEAIKLEGEAEAEAILARGRAEAEAMRLKAEAFAKYGEAAVLDLLVKVLPEVVGAASAPMSGIDKMTVISTDGASSLTKSVAANVAQGLQLGSDLTGVDLGALLRRPRRTGRARRGRQDHHEGDRRLNATGERGRSACRADRPLRTERAGVRPGQDRRTNSPANDPSSDCRRLSPSHWYENGPVSSSTTSSVGAPKIVTEASERWSLMRIRPLSAV